MKKGVLALALLLVATSSPVAVGAEEDDKRVTARLAPRNEVPAVSSPAARGSFRAEIDDDARSIEYELKFEGLQADIIMAHLHFAQPNVNGAIMVWLCGTSITTPPTPGPAGTQTCAGPRAGMVSGTVLPGQIQTIATQGIASGEFEELVDAIRHGLVYVNVHTTQSPGGEIRGQIRVRD